MPSRSNPMASWDATRQQTYRAQHPEAVFVFHLLLDASGSMQVHERSLRVAANRYITWLQQYGPPMALMDVRAFGSTLQASRMRPLGEIRPLTDETYSACLGGTALRDALGAIGTQTAAHGQKCW
jgi:hypothetical protein